MGRVASFFFQVYFYFMEQRFFMAPLIKKKRYFQMPYNFQINFIMSCKSNYFY